MNNWIETNLGASLFILIILALASFAGIAVYDIHSRNERFTCMVADNKEGK